MSLDKYVSYAAKSFTLPDICVRLRSTLDDPRSSAEDIGELISAEASVSPYLQHHIQSFGGQAGNVTVSEALDETRG